MSWKPNEATQRLQKIKAGAYRNKTPQNGNKPQKEIIPEKGETPDPKEEQPVKPQKKSVKKKIRQASKKRAKQNRAYTPLRKKFLQDHPMCEGNLDGCTGAATEVHHAAGRSGVQLLKIDDFKALCHSCHETLKTKDKEARQRGLVTTRLGKVKK